MATQVRTYVQEKYVVKKSKGLVNQESAYERGKGTDTAKGQDRETYCTMWAVTQVTMMKKIVPKAPAPILKRGLAL